MRVLYGIFVLSVGALVWAAVAAARHIRRHETQTTASQEKHPQVEGPLDEEVVPAQTPYSNKRQGH
jgi:hypothetical protein